jgi:hypothetical protein
MSPLVDWSRCNALLLLLDLDPKFFILFFDFLYIVMRVKASLEYVDCVTGTLKTKKNALDCHDFRRGESRVMENLSLFFSQLSIRFPKDRFFPPPRDEKAAENKKTKRRLPFIFSRTTREKPDRTIYTQRSVYLYEMVN